MTHLKWAKVRYDGYSAQAAPFITLGVHRRVGTRNGPPPRWKWNALGTGSSDEYDTPEAAKVAVEAFVRGHVLTASNALT